MGGYAGYAGYSGAPTDDAPSVPIFQFSDPAPTPDPTVATTDAATSPPSSPAATTAMRHSASAAAPLLMPCATYSGDPPIQFPKGPTAGTFAPHPNFGARRGQINRAPVRLPPVRGKKAGALPLWDTTHRAGCGRLVALHEHRYDRGTMAEDPARIVSPSLRDDDPAVRALESPARRPDLSRPRAVSAPRKLPNASAAHLPVSPRLSDPQAPRQGVHRERYHHVALHRVQLRAQEPLAAVPARRQRVLSLNRDAPARRLLPGALPDALVHDHRAARVRPVHKRRKGGVRRLLQAPLRRGGQRHAVRPDPPPEKPATRRGRPHDDAGDDPMEGPPRRRYRARAQQPGAPRRRRVRPILGPRRRGLRRDGQPRRRDEPQGEASVRHPRGGFGSRFRSRRGYPREGAPGRGDPVRGSQQPAVQVRG